MCMLDTDINIVNMMHTARYDPVGAGNATSLIDLGTLVHTTYVV